MEYVQTQVCSIRKGSHVFLPPFMIFWVTCCVKRLMLPDSGVTESDCLWAGWVSLLPVVVQCGRSSHNPVTSSFLLFLCIGKNWNYVSCSLFLFVQPDNLPQLKKLQFLKRFSMAQMGNLEIQPFIKEGVVTFLKFMSMCHFFWEAILCSPKGKKIVLSTFL